MKAWAWQVEPRCEAVLRAVADHWAAHHYGPSVRDIQAATGLVPSQVHAYMARLRRRGLLTWDARRARSVQLTAEGAACGAAPSGGDSHPSIC